MPEYLFFRLPRRQPRVLAAKTHGNRLAIIVSDPWEMRTIAEHPIPINPEKRQDKCQIILQETIIRERPQALVVLSSRSTARCVMKQFSHHFGLPLVEISPNEWQKVQNDLKTRTKTGLKAFFKSLPTRHVSKILFKNGLLLKTALLIHAALSFLLKQSYDAQSDTESKQ